MCFPFRPRLGLHATASASLEPQDSTGGYLCGPHVHDGRAHLAPVPLDTAQQLAWDGIIMRSATFASHDENAN